MTALGCVLGDAAGLGVTAQLMGAGLSLPAALGYIVPLAGMCLAGTMAAESLDEFARLKRVFQAELIPQLGQLPLWGLGLLALGAGVGEETLFRGFMQTAAIQGLGGVLPADAATAAGLAASAVIFGALHALTPSYFLFATAAGFVFGFEYLQHGLQTAAATHWLYDWAALIYIIRVWGGPAGSDGDSDGGGRSSSDNKSGAGPEPGSVQQGP
ncbi:hypothetical protein ABPG75_009040 [Micractinium tetrahymenae]